MTHSFYRNACSILLLMTLFVSAIHAQSVTFNVSTVAYGGKYSPKNCFVLWITDSNGQYVKTINRQSKNYTSKLTNWSSNSGSKTTDGMTGATINSHNAATNPTGGASRLPFTWNCKDYSGNTVADGTYYVNIEFTEESTSKYIRYDFVKGPTNQTVSYPNVTTSPGKYFQNASLNYTAPITSLKESKNTETYNIYFSNSSKLLQVNYEAQEHEAVVLTLINQSGRIVYRKKQSDEISSLDLSKLQAGVYLVKVSDKAGKTQTCKIFIK